jgi:nucleoside-diphosphate-sugar epimerase
VKLLLTGASGFIGQHVLARLRQCEGVELLVLSRTPASAPQDLSSIVGSIGADAPDWDELGRPDVVLNLAWGGLPNYRSSHHFDEAYHHSRFLRRLMAQGLPRLVCAGTCFEYGMKDGCLVEDQPTDPGNPYGLAKDILRRQLMLDGAHTQLLWTRFFYLYGEGQAPSSLFAQVRNAIAQGETVFRMSGGEQLRDFMPVETAVDYLVRLALSPKAEGIINIASGNPVSVRRLVERWFTDAGHQISLDLGQYPYPDWEPFAFWGSVAKLSAALAHA